MKTRALLLLKKHPPALPPPEAPLEWLVTNGLGGYAFGSVDGPPLRRFHGLPPARSPAGRQLAEDLSAIRRSWFDAMCTYDASSSFCPRSSSLV